MRRGGEGEKGDKGGRDERKREIKSEIRGT